MATVEHLRNAPIREALIDLRIPEQRDLDLSRLRALCKGLDSYPTLHESVWFQGMVQLTPTGEMLSGEPERYINGYRAISADERAVVQFRTDGFTFSRLHPYTSWEEIADEARRLWIRYVDVVNPRHVDRLGLRYINHLRFPHPILNIGDYIVGLPNIPRSWPQVISNFLFRTTLFDDANGLSANVTQALVEEPNPELIGVLFDIDVFREAEIRPADEDVWGTMELLRDLKNRIFFDGVTERTVEMYR